MSNPSNNTKITVLIIGDAGPSRAALLQRPDIEAFWTTSMVGALGILREQSPKVCIVHPESIEKGFENFVGACKREDGPPCIVLLSAAKWSTQGHWLSAGASEVVQVELSQTLLNLLGEYTDLKFAKEERANLELPVDVAFNGQTTRQYTNDLSASGMSLRHMTASVGDLFHLHLRIEGEEMELWGRVVRSWKVSNESRVGLRFVGITSAQAAKIRLFVREQNEVSRPPSISLSNLFDGVELSSRPDTLSPEDFATESNQKTDWLADAVAHFQILERYAETKAGEIPEFLRRFFLNLSSLEVEAIRTGHPQWVNEIVNTLVCIETWQQSHPGLPIPIAITERAAEQYDSLSTREKRDESLAVQASVLRAHLLKYLFQNSSAMRA
ncbi:MAG: PilZ domain-containing protein [Myxococcota bacterium]|nr:PilZ domain-containing protein [Myxococcota bacterium]